MHLPQWKLYLLVACGSTLWGQLYGVAKRWSAAAPVPTEDVQCAAPFGAEAAAFLALDLTSMEVQDAGVFLAEGVWSGQERGP